MNRIVQNETSYHGAGAVKEIVNELWHRGLKKPIVFSDANLVQFGITKKITGMLDAAKVKYSLYSDFKPNPTIANVKNGVKAFKAAKADCIIAIGGGSAMSVAKAVGIIIANPKFNDVRSLEGVAPTRNPSKPILAVPTTAGTAAEVSINYVITDVEKKRMFVCVDPHAIPVVAFVDSTMMSTMPKDLTAFTGMDALTHAIEGYITKAACPMTDMMHLEAIRLVSLHLRDAVANKPSGREGMALGQYIAGMGYSNVGLGVGHAMAHGLSALYDMPHGKACAILLPTAMKFNAPATGAKYRKIAEAMGVKGVEKMTLAQARKAAIAAVEKLSADVGIPPDLKGVLKKEDVQFLAESAYADACRPGNPRDCSVEQIAKLYKSLMKWGKELESSLASTQSEIAALKAKCEPQKTSHGKCECDEKSVTYLDVYDRVQNFMAYNTGFAPDDGIGEEDVVDICTDEEGNEHKHWTNPRAFVGGDENESSVFEEVAYLDDIYYKLASRWDAEFVDACRILGTVKVKDRSPAGIMKALDEAGL